MSPCEGKGGDVGWGLGSLPGLRFLCRTPGPHCEARGCRKGELGHRGAMQEGSAVGAHSPYVRLWPDSQGL